MIEGKHTAPDTLQSRVRARKNLEIMLSTKCPYYFYLPKFL